MTDYIVSSGQVNTGLALGRGDQLTILNGGTARLVIAQGDAGVTVQNGGLAIGVDLVGATEWISGGVASLTCVGAGGSQFVLSGGVASRTLIVSGGVQSVTDGAAERTVVESGGTQILGDLSLPVAGAVADHTTVFGSQTVLTGQISNTVIGSGGMSVLVLGTAVDTLISAGGYQDVNLGFADRTTVLSGGIQFTAGSVTDTLVSQGGQQIVQSGVASHTILNGDQEIVLGVASGTMVHQGGFQHVSGKGLAIDTVISAGGVQSVSGYARDTVLMSGGEQVTGGAGSYATDTVIEAGGLLVNLNQPIGPLAGVLTKVLLMSGGTLDMTTIAFAADGSATLDPQTDVLTITEDGHSRTMQMLGNYAGERFILSDDQRGGTDVSVTGTARQGMSLATEIRVVGSAGGLGAGHFAGATAPAPEPVADRATVASGPPIATHPEAALPLAILHPL